MFTKIFWQAAGARALHTFAQTAISVLPAPIIIEAMPWWMAVSTALSATILSILKSIVIGTPEGGPGVVND